ncbi:hypothetical protein Egran_05614, partial [Elaphomyces granulatus]
MQPSHRAAVTSANIALGSPPGTRFEWQPARLQRGNVVFSTCDEIHKHETTRELVKADGIVQGLESLSRPQEIHTDHNGDPLSYSDALLQDPTNWLPAIKEQLNSHEENGTWIVQETSQMPKGSKPIPG